MTCNTGNHYFEEIARKSDDDPRTFFRCNISFSLVLSISFINFPSKNSRESLNILFVYPGGIYNTDTMYPG